MRLRNARVEWLYSLAAAVLAGGANAVAGSVIIYLIDPIRFSAQSPDFYKLVLGMFIASAVVSLLYLKPPRAAAEAELERWPPTDHAGRHLRLVVGHKRT